MSTSNSRCSIVSPDQNRPNLNLLVVGWYFTCTDMNLDRLISVITASNYTYFGTASLVSENPVAAYNLHLESDVLIGR